MIAKKKNLLNKINYAFMNCPCPKKIAMIDDWNEEEINKDFSPFIKGYVDSHVLENHAKSLPALTAQAFAFFLKDYLVYAINNVDSELTDNLVYRLSALDLSEQYWKERVSYLTIDQLSVIGETLNFIKMYNNEENEYFNSLIEKTIFLWNELQSA
ncbi:DUF6714 family protein [Cellvibrio mixtus]|uniref:DUF6714 family protein n=1 Tax=Cellvibrio mixtus TaxID=39650 RepID=UPI000587FA61|nr:DUF6714 family protein [Cellvibrio mixtus]